MARHPRPLEAAHQGSAQVIQHGAFQPRHALTWFILALLAVTLVVSWFGLQPNWVSDQQDHGGSAALWPEYWTWWAGQLAMSWAAEPVGLLIMVRLVHRLRETDSSEGRN